MKQEQAQPQPVQSVNRVLDIMEALGAAPAGLSLSDLAAATALHASTAFRLMATLAARGFVMKDGGTGRYRLTLRMFEIGGRVSGVNQLLAVAAPLLDALAAEMLETVHLVRRAGDEVVYLYKAEPYQQQVRIGSYVGCRNPMYCTGVGKSILALLPEQEVRAIWARSEIRAHTPKTIMDYDRLAAELALTRQRGYALDEEEHESGVRCLAVAICGAGGTPEAAVSVSAPVFRMDEATQARIYPRLRTLAAQLGTFFGAVAQPEA